jgi:hypothetical protein
MRFQCKIWPGDISKPAAGNESLYESSNDNGVTTASFATYKNLSVAQFSPSENLAWRYFQTSSWE